MENISYKWHYDYIKLAWDTGFTFKKYKGREIFNKNSIAAIDIDRIIEERDIGSVEKHINNLLQFSLDTNEMRILEPNFVKVFQLSQLAVEYLIYCKKYLDHALVILKYDHEKTCQENRMMKKEIDSFRSEKNKLKKENKELKSLLQSDDEDLKIKIQCTECDKYFMSKKFLNIHLEKRHNIHDTTRVVEKNKLQQEIDDLKEKLNKPEYFNLRDEPKNTDGMEELRNQFNLLKTQVENELSNLKQDKTKEINKVTCVADKNIQTEDLILNINCSTQTELESKINEIKKEPVEKSDIKNLSRKITDKFTDDFQKLFNDLSFKVFDKFQNLNNRIDSLYTKVDTVKQLSNKSSKISINKSGFDSVTKYNDILLENEEKTTDDESFDLKKKPAVKFTPTASLIQISSDEFDNESEHFETNHADKSEDPVDFESKTVVDGQTFSVKNTEVKSIESRFSNVVSEIKQVVESRRLDDTTEESEDEKPQYPITRVVSNKTIGKKKEITSMYSKVDSDKSESDTESSIRNIPVKSKIIVSKSLLNVNDDLKNTISGPEIQDEINCIVSDRMQNLGINPAVPGLPNNIYQNTIKIVNSNRKISMKQCKSFGAVSEEILNELEMKINKTSNLSLNIKPRDEKKSKTNHFKSFFSSIKNKIY